MKEATQCSCYGQLGRNMEIFNSDRERLWEDRKELIEDLEEERNRF